ncbi:reverse transcriptase [Penicillium lividum]|nr:reverse transcriptase [Penicillium lividum]
MMETPSGDTSLSMPLITIFAPYCIAKPQRKTSKWLESALPKLAISFDSRTRSRLRRPVITLSGYITWPRFGVVVYRTPTEEFNLETGATQVAEKIIEDNDLAEHGFRIEELAWIKSKDKTLGKFVSLGIWFDSVEGAEYILRDARLRRRDASDANGLAIWYGRARKRHDVDTMRRQLTPLDAREKSPHPIVEHNEVGTENGGTDQRPLELRSRYYFDLGAIHHYISLGQNSTIDQTLYHENYGSDYRATKLNEKARKLYERADWARIGEEVARKMSSWKDIKTRPALDRVVEKLISATA